MNRHEYLTYRRLVRDNRTYALRWVPRETAEELRRLLREQSKVDPLAVHAGVLAYQRRGAAAGHHAPAFTHRPPGRRPRGAKPPPRPGPGAHQTPPDPPRNPQC